MGLFCTLFASYFNISNLVFCWKFPQRKKYHFKRVGGPEKMKDEDFFVLGWKQGGGLPGVHQTLVNYPSSNRGAFQQPCNLSLIGVCFTNPVLSVNQQSWAFSSN